nr:MAG TPA_asm: hypothetical protein [Caudoviricetes sp.]DAX12462.1 MAG TPA: hypothetical protein [Caudoviricetes sp.]
MISYIRICFLLTSNILYHIIYHILVFLKELI